MRRETLTAVINLCGGEGAGGFPGNGLTKSGDTSRHIERGGLENDSECTSIHVCYVYIVLSYVLDAATYLC